MKTVHFETIDSTNTYLKKNYQSLDNRTFVSAGYQTQGRGRNNRNWKSENGSNLLFSLLIKDEELMREYRSLSIISALSVIEVLKDYGIKDLSIKWPNDVYVKDNKITGILLEGVSIDKIECIIIGIGINVNQKDFAGEYLHMPTSMALETGKDINIKEFKERLFKHIDENLNKILNNYPFYEDIKKLDYLKDKEVYALIHDQSRKIKVLGINKDYSLKIKHDYIEDIESGEISFHL